MLGHVGWGIAWYINGLLIPEIYVVRGKTYNFVVEGGQNPNSPASYHPFYITDDPEGGYQFKSPEERKKVEILCLKFRGRLFEQKPMLSFSFRCDQNDKSRVVIWVTLCCAT